MQGPLKSILSRKFFFAYVIFQKKTGKPGTQQTPMPRLHPSTGLRCKMMQRLWPGRPGLIELCLKRKPSTQKTTKSIPEGNSGDLGLDIFGGSLLAYASWLHPALTAPIFA
jgi:hypothetical protein